MEFGMVRFQDRIWDREKFKRDGGGGSYQISPGAWIRDDKKKKKDSIDARGNWGGTLIGWIERKGFTPERKLLPSGRHWER